MVYHEASTPQSHNHDHDWSSQATLNFRFLRFTGFLYFSPVGTTLLPLRVGRKFHNTFGAVKSFITDSHLLYLKSLHHFIEFLKVYYQKGTSGGQNVGFSGNVINAKQNLTKLWQVFWYGIKKTIIDNMRYVIRRYDQENIFLATDDDMEGEKIAFDICNIFELPLEKTNKKTFI